MNQLLWVSLYGPDELVKCELQPQNRRSSLLLIAASFVKRKVLLKKVVIRTSLFDPNPVSIIAKLYGHGQVILASLPLFSPISQGCV